MAVIMAFGATLGIMYLLLAIHDKYTTLTSVLHVDNTEDVDDWSPDIK